MDPDHFNTGNSLQPVHFQLFFLANCTVENKNRISERLSNYYKVYIKLQFRLCTSLRHEIKLYVKYTIVIVRRMFYLKWKLPYTPYNVKIVIFYKKLSYNKINLILIYIKSTVILNNKSIGTNKTIIYHVEMPHFSVLS